MNDRETKTLEIAGHKVIIKTYLTAGERRSLRSLLLSSLKFDILEEKPDIKDFSPELIEKTEDKTIEIVVVSLDDSTENIFQRMMELKDNEFDAIMTEVNKVTQGEDLEGKKKN